METNFVFVNGIEADRATKRRMRSHVMKGKNTGRRLCRASRLDFEIHRRRPNRLQAVQRIQQPKGYTSESVETVPRPIGSAIRSLSTPVKVTANSEQIVNNFFGWVADRIYQTRLGVSIYDAKRSWLPFLLADEATYHCSLALMQAATDIFVGDGSYSRMALYHLSKALASFNDRMKSDEAISDSTIAIIIALIFQEQFRHQYSSAAVHINGLARIVELRGGINHMDAEAGLVLKICKTDITFALQYGSPALFFRDRMADVRNNLAADGLDLSHVPTSAVTRCHRLDRYLENIFQDIMSICRLFNRGLGGKTVGSVLFLDMIVSVFYRLLRFRPLTETSYDLDSQTLHCMALLAFMMTVFLQHDSRRVANFPLVFSRFREVLECNLNAHDDDFILWTVFLGGIWAMDDLDSNWFVPQICKVAQRLDVCTWDEAKCVLCRFPWLDGVHEETGLKLWSQVQDCLSPTSLVRQV